MSDSRSPQVQLQDIVDDVSVLLGAPTVLEDTAFTLIAYSSQGGVDVDPVRAASILGKTPLPRFGPGSRSTELPPRPVRYGCRETPS